MIEKPAIGIFGAGWVGLVTGACFADLGHRVVVRDVLEERIEMLNAGRLPFHEADLPEVIERNRERLTFTLDAEELTSATDLFFACVDTPPTASGDADLSKVWSVIDDLGDPGDAILVMKSTVPVGTGERIRRNLDERGLQHVGYVSNPEFLAEGRAVADFMSPDRVVIGAFDEAHGDRVASLYEGFDTPIVRMSVPSAEMVKLAANAFLATRISFINEIANVSEAVGADVEDVAKGVGLDHRLGPHFLRAGIGFGGSCFPKDVSFLKLSGRQQRLPLPARERGHRGQRAPEAPRRPEAQGSPGGPARQDDRPARPLVQAGHRRHARGAVDRARLAAAGRGCGRERVGPARQEAIRPSTAWSSTRPCSTRFAMPTRP